MATLLAFTRSGAVGFIDWLDAAILRFRSRSAFPVSKSAATETWSWKLSQCPFTLRKSEVKAGPPLFGRSRFGVPTRHITHDRILVSIRERPCEYQLIGH